MKLLQKATRPDVFRSVTYCARQGEGAELAPAVQKDLGTVAHPHSCPTAGTPGRSLRLSGLGEQRK